MIQSNTIVRIINRPYPIVLGNFMLLLGAYFLLSAIVKHLSRKPCLRDVGLQYMCYIASKK